MNEQVVALLEAGLGLIPTPAQWTKQMWARDARGKRCSPFSEDAVCFCSDGALLRAQDDVDASQLVRKEAERALRKAFGGGYVRVNDAPETTHEMVVAGWKRAIELAKAAAP